MARLAELMRFGSVGLAAFIVDVGLFNLIRFGPGQLLLDQPLTAKIISVSAAMLVAWLGNRYWTFATRRSTSGAVAGGWELGKYVIANLIGMAIALACLWFSHYVLVLTSPLADNIAANGVGLVLGTIFRYLAYRHWVFNGAAVGTTGSVTRRARRRR